MARYRKCFEAVKSGGHLSDTMRVELLRWLPEPELVDSGYQPFDGADEAQESLKSISFTLSTRIDELEDQLASLEAELETERDSAEEMREEMVERHDAELAKADAALREGVREVTSQSNAVIIDLKNTIEDLQDDLTETTDRLEEKIEQVAELKMDNTKLLNQYSDLKKKYDAISKSIAMAIGGTDV